MSNYWEQIQLEALQQEAKESKDAERLRELAQMNAEIAQAVASNPDAPADLLVELSRHEDEDVKLALLQNAALPERCFAALAQDAPQNRARAIATNRRTPPEVLRALASSRTQSGNSYSTSMRAKILLAIAAHPNTPPDTLEELSEQPIAAVYRAAQKNINNPLYVVGTPRQRWSRERRRRSPYEAAGAPAIFVEEMIRSDVWQQRWNAAYYADLSEEQLALLAKDPNAAVRESIARTRPLSNNLAELLLERDARGLLANRTLPQDLRRRAIEKMLQGPEEQRAFIASDRSLSIDDQQKLAGDTSVQVRLNLTYNSQLPLQILERLSEDSSAEVRRAVLNHPKTTPELKEKIARLEPALQLPTLNTAELARGLLQRALGAQPTPQTTRPPQKEPNFNVMGGAMLALSLCFAVFYAYSEESVNISAMIVTLFLGILLLSANKEESATKKRGMAGVGFLVSGVFFLPLFLALKAPLWLVLFGVYLLIIGAALLFTASTSARR